MKLTASNVARYFLYKAKDTTQQHEIDSMKLNKLVYIAYGWYAGLKGKPLFEELPQVWKYGPVVPSVYHEFKHFGRAPIDPEEEGFKDPGLFITDPDVWEFLDKIWEVYGKYTAIELSQRTHRKGTPWDIMWNHRGGMTTYSLDIPFEEVKKYYRDLTTQNGG